MKKANEGHQLPAEVEELIKKETYQNLQDEWSGLTPSDKDMGVVTLYLDKGVKTTVMGTVYGLDYEIEDDSYSASVYIDYYNKRLKISDYQATDYQKMIKRFSWIAEANQFDKIFVKTKSEDFQEFLSRGYVMEGVLRYYFSGEDAYVLSRFSSEERIHSDCLIEEGVIVEDIIYGSKKKEVKPLSESFEIRTATLDDIPQLVYIYRSVFETYPSPLANPDYIKSAMGRDVIFKLAFEDGMPIAAASAEILKKHSNAEMTDCATIPAAQGRGIMQHLLADLENVVREKGIKTAYTLARAQSIGMNKSFFRLRYEYSGRLINNCDIFGQFEDLNIWVKKLS